MPEGPEIRRAADRVQGAIAAMPLRRVFFKFPRLKRYQRILTGREVTRIDTAGKAMLTRFDNGLTLYSHNQLYGRWYVTGGDAPDTSRSLRVGLVTDSAAAFLYSASEIEVLTPAQLAGHPFLQRLGPDILAAGTNPASVAERLAAPPFKRRSLGSLYLDQGFLAGVGNYLRSEILHAAGLDYRLTPQHLDSADRRRLARATCAISQRAYRTGGITNPRAMVRRLKAAGENYQQHRFAVFGRAGYACRRCGSKIQRVSVAGRRLYACPSCQPRSSA